MKFQDLRAFVCVPALGKTYLCHRDDKYVDMDELKARYKYAQENATSEELEWQKGNRGEAIRGHSIEYVERRMLDFLENTDKILLFAPNPQIVDMLLKNNVPYCLIFHSKDCASDIEQRMRNRGNQENFIRTMVASIDGFYVENAQDQKPCMKIELHRGEYLADVFENPDKFLKRSKKYNKKMS